MKISINEEIATELPIWAEKIVNLSPNEPINDKPALRDAGNDDNCKPALRVADNCKPALRDALDNKPALRVAVDNKPALRVAADNRPVLRVTGSADLSMIVPGGGMDEQSMGDLLEDPGVFPPTDPPSLQVQCFNCGTIDHGDVKSVAIKPGQLKAIS